MHMALADATGMLAMEAFAALSAEVDYKGCKRLRMEVQQVRALHVFCAKSPAVAGKLCAEVISVAQQKRFVQ